MERVLIRDEPDVHRDVWCDDGHKTSEILTGLSII
jgi:hypothetical protein